MIGVIHVTNATVDAYRAPGKPTGWEVELTPEMGNPLPGDRVRIRRGRLAAVPGRVYAVDYTKNKLLVELAEDEAQPDE
jgi:hypothetical protein